MADFGRQLKDAREQRGVSLRQIATTTKISIAALEALERNDFSRLPGGIFSRAFVRAYAFQVGLDPEQTVQEFLVEYEQNDNAAAEKAPPEVTADDRAFLERQRRAALWLRAGSVVLLLSLVAIVIAWQFRSRAKSAAEEGGAAAPAATVDPPAAPQTAPPAPGQQGAAAPVAAPAPMPAPAAVTPKDDEVALHLEMTADCWTRVTVDGVPLFEQTLKAGDTRDVQPARDVYIQIGNAGAMKWTINGQPAKALGKIGQLAVVHVTRASLAKYLQ